MHTWSLEICSVCSCSGSVLSMSETAQIVTPNRNTVPVWQYFRFVKNQETGKLVVTAKATCKLSRSVVVQSGGTTNLKKSSPPPTKKKSSTIKGEFWSSSIF